MGKEQDGFLNVETSKGAGWVKKVLVDALSHPSAGRVCFVTCRTWPDISDSDALVQAASSSAGVSPSAACPWNGADQRFDDFDAVILRLNCVITTTRWRRSPPGHRAHSLRPGRRPTPLVRWNLSKRYLLELAAAGVPPCRRSCSTTATPPRSSSAPWLSGRATAVVKPAASPVAAPHSR